MYQEAVGVSDSNLRGVMLCGETKCLQFLTMTHAGKWMTFLQKWVLAVLSCFQGQTWLHTDGMGSLDIPEGSQLPPKEDSGNTEPNLPLEDHPAHGGAQDLGESEDSDFVMVLQLISFVTWGKSFKF